MKDDPYQPYHSANLPQMPRAMIDLFVDRLRTQTMLLISSSQVGLWRISSHLWPD